MRVYPSRNIFASESFLKSVLKHCEGKPRFIVDGAPWLGEASIEMGLTHQQQSFGPRSLVESSFSSFEQRTKIFFNKITANLKHNRHPRWKS